jgi:hypothetical protein
MLLRRRRSKAALEATISRLREAGSGTVESLTTKLVRFPLVKDAELPKN